MKIEIRKENGKSRILLDGKPVENGCMGFEITSRGGDCAILTLKFIVKNLDFSAAVDVIGRDQEAFQTTPTPRRFRLNWPKG